MKMIQLTSRTGVIFFLNPLSICDVWPFGTEASEISLTNGQPLQVLEDPNLVATLFEEATVAIH